MLVPLWIVCNMFLSDFIESIFELSLPTQGDIIVNILIEIWKITDDTNKVCSTVKIFPFSYEFSKYSTWISSWKYFILRFIDVKRSIKKEEEFYIGVITSRPQFKNCLGRLTVSFLTHQQHNQQMAISHDTFDSTNELRLVI